MEAKLVEGPVVDEKGVARVRYEIGEDWTISIERDLAAPIGGPSAVRIWATTGADLGGYDSDGIQAGHLRAIPIGDARKLLEEAWVAMKARSLIDAIPDDFDHQYAYACLAEAVVVMTGWGISRPISVIARAKEGDTPSRQARDRWGMRAKRARSYGFLADAETTVDGELEREVVLTAKASALLKRV